MRPGLESTPRTSIRCLFDQPGDEILQGPSEDTGSFNDGSTNLRDFLLVVPNTPNPTSEGRRSPGASVPVTFPKDSVKFIVEETFWTHENCSTCPEYSGRPGRYTRLLDW